METIFKGKRASTILLSKQLKTLEHQLLNKTPQDAKA
jgi:hypothetical protein